jgi:hypothetical protein
MLDTVQAFYRLSEQAAVIIITDLREAVFASGPAGVFCGVLWLEWVT